MEAIYQVICIACAKSFTFLFALASSFFIVPKNRSKFFISSCHMEEFACLVVKQIGNFQASKSYTKKKLKMGAV